MGLFDDSDSGAQDYLKQALDAYKNVSVPTLAAGQVNDIPLETVQGTVTPDNIDVKEQDPSAYNDIALDPATRAAQMSALSQFQNIAGAGGLDAGAKLSIQEAIDAANNQSRGAQGAIMNAAQASGNGGGDFALTQRALAAQAASNTAANQGMQAAAQAEANRESALSAMANIGGSINGADFSQASTKAAAQNAINAANQNATNAANTNNVANKANAAEFNTTNAQGVNSRNTGAGQNQVYYNAGLPQQQFNNEIAKAGGIAGVSGQQATAAQNATNANNAMTGALLGAGGTIAGAALGGPAGAAIGGSLGNAAGGQPKTNAAIAGTQGYKTNAAANSPLGYSKGGYTCYADGGVAHDHGICMKLGGHVPGKAEKEGDSAANDTVPAMLSPGELVIPRSVPKTGEAMEQFAAHAPVGGTKKKVDLTSMTKNYKRGK